jgi:protein gp37
MPTKIEWCDKTINPLGYGCYGTGTKEKPEVCPYCYAYKIARRNMRGCKLCKQFIPHPHYEQLDKLKQWKNGKSIFVQSMGDLFHDEISDEWIDDILLASRLNPQHRYLFLTKNPKRYIDLHGKGILPKSDNMWFGSTTVIDTAPAFYSVNHNTFVSIEPIMSEFETGGKAYGNGNIDWVIVGCETGNRKGKVIPKREWIENIVESCREHNVPVFIKNNLANIWGEPLIQEFPW